MTVLLPLAPLQDPHPRKLCLAIALADQAHLLPHPVEHLPDSDALTPGVLLALRPDRVAVPLFGLGADALDLAERLHKMGFQGELLVHAVGLPRPKLVEREIGRPFPGLKVRVGASFTEAR